MNIDSKKLYIIGNGFDLNLGYPTRFKDFVDFCINWKKYYNKPDKEKFARDKNINDFKLTIDKNGKQVNHWRDGISKLKMNFDNSERTILKTFDHYIDNNGIIKYLAKSKRTIKYERWSDFENYLLEICEMCDEHEKQILEYSRIKDNGGKFKYSDEFYNFLNYVYVANSFYSSDFPNKIIVETVVRIDKLKFIQELSKQLQSFSRAFNIYLKLFVGKMEVTQLSDIDNDEDVFVLDFNYTNFCKTIFNKSKINYIHGYQHDDNIIIGINDNKLSTDYDCLRKNFLRLAMNVQTKQVNQTDLTGEYEDFDEYLSQSYNDGVRTPIYVIIIGQSLNKVDWDVLINYFNNENKYYNIIFCYHNTYDSQLLNLYQMLKRFSVGDDIIESRITNGYYRFHKYDNLKTLLNEVSIQLKSFMDHKHTDLGPKEEMVLKEIFKNYDELIKGRKILTAVKELSEDETSDLLESLCEKGYIKIKSIFRNVGGPSRPYLIEKVLKF